MTRLAGIALTVFPATAMAHATGAPHLHAEHGAGWLLGVALIAAAAGLAALRARTGRRK